MIKSLPQITEGMILRCLTGVGLYEGEITAERFKKIDSTGNDIRRLFNQLSIIEKTTRQSKKISFTKMGTQLYENIENHEKFGDLLHSVLMSKIPQYRILTDFLVDNHQISYKNKISVFKELKERQSTSGWNLPEPTFKSLMVLAELSQLIKMNGNLHICRINDSSFYMNIFKQCILEQQTKTNSKQFSTYNLLDCFENKMKEIKTEITLDISLELLKTFADELDIRFVFGVGQEVNKIIIPGTHAMVEYLGDYS